MTPSPHDKPQLASRLLSVAISTALFGLLSGSSHLWSSNGLTLFPAFRYSLCVALPLMLLALSLVRGKVRTLSLDTSGFAFGLLLVLVTDWLERSYNFFQGPSIRGEVLLLSLVGLFTVRLWSPRAFAVLALGSCALLIGCFLAHSGVPNGSARLLFSDDHATFLFRLFLLRDNFPRIPFYYPLWNGGMDARDFFATGALNFFALSAPVVYFTDLIASYNWLVAFVLFLFLPLTMWSAARLARLTAIGSALCAILSLTTGLMWYRWALKYGTMGFITTACLVPLNFFLLSKLVSLREQITRLEAIACVVLVTLMLLWTPSGIIFLPMAALALVRLPKLLSKHHFISVCAALLIINLPWLTLFWSVSNLNTFLSSASPSQTVEEIAPAPDFRHRYSSISLSKSLRVIRETAISTNPLILFLAIPGIFLLPSTARTLFLVTSAWLLLLGSVVVPLKPQLEFDRMLLLLTLLWCIPCACALTNMRETLLRFPSLFPRVATCLAFGFLFTGPFCAGTVLLNRSVEQYAFASPLVDAMADAIRTYAPSGRVLFSGFVLHELSGGHVAPLTELTGKPLMASSQFHNRWKYTQIFPRSFLARGDAGIEEYLDLYNVSTVIAHEKYWRDYFSDRSSLYEQVWNMDRFVMFRRRNFVDNYFLSGAGQLVEQSSNSVVVRMQSEDATLKFNFFPFLRSSGCRIESAGVAPEVSLIKLSACAPGSLVTIRSAPGRSRIFS